MCSGTGVRKHKALYFLTPGSLHITGKQGIVPQRKEKVRGALQGQHDEATRFRLAQQSECGEEGKGVGTEGKAVKRWRNVSTVQLLGRQKGGTKVQESSTIMLMYLTPCAVKYP
jgi:hypothetical protein